MICQSCNSSDLIKLSLIHAAGLYESRGRIRGFLLGQSDGLLFGSYRGKNQSSLSKMVRPPAKFPYATPAILWLVGFFLLMALVDRGKLSFAMGLVSVAYACCFLLWLFRPSFTTGSYIPKSTGPGTARLCASGAERLSTLTIAYNRPHKLKTAIFGESL